MTHFTHKYLFALTLTLALALFALAAPGARAAVPAAAATTSTQTTLTEPQKVQYLIKLVEKSDLVFIRNGREYGSKKAAEHLQKKWDYARKRYADKLKTAGQFIEHIATKSSFSGKPYQIRFKDGRTVASGKWLTERLKELESGAVKPAAAPRPGA